MSGLKNASHLTRIHDALLADLVRDWTDRVLPGETEVANRAVTLALECHSSGAPVSEACREARWFVESWIRHPSHPRPVPGTLRAF